MSTADLYNYGYYQEYEYSFKNEHRQDHEEILKLLAIKEDDRVLEIGCGLGVLLSKIPSRKRVGVETNDSAIEECKKRGLSVTKVSNEEKLPFADRAFDIVIMNEVIEHLKDPGYALSECFRILSPNGRVIITTPIRSFFVHNLSSTHFSEMTTKEVASLMSDHGFKILSQEVSGLSFLYPLLENLIFRPFRLIKRAADARGSGSTSKAVDGCHLLADKTLLKPLALYRKTFLRLGTNQIILGQKVTEATGKCG